MMYVLKPVDLTSCSNLNFPSSHNAPGSNNMTCGWRENGELRQSGRPGNYGRRRNGRGRKRRRYVGQSTPQLIQYNIQITYR